MPKEQMYAPKKIIISNSVKINLRREADKKPIGTIFSSEHYQ